MLRRQTVQDRGVTAFEFDSLEARSLFKDHPAVESRGTNAGTQAAPPRGPLYAYWGVTHHVRADT
jgi:hypothetical protein